MELLAVRAMGKLLWEIVRRRCGCPARAVVISPEQANALFVVSVEEHVPWIARLVLEARE